MKCDVNAIENHAVWTNRTVCDTKSSENKQIEQNQCFTFTEDVMRSLLWLIPRPDMINNNVATYNFFPN